MSMVRQAEVDALFERRREMELTYMESKQKRCSGGGISFVFLPPARTKRLFYTARRCLENRGGGRGRYGTEGEGGGGREAGVQRNYAKGAVKQALLACEVVELETITCRARERGRTPQEGVALDGSSDSSALNRIRRISHTLGLEYKRASKRPVKPYSRGRSIRNRPFPPLR